MNNEVIKKPHTSCLGCTFALYSPEGEQADYCHANRVQFFEKDLVDHGDNKSFLLKGICNMYRECDGSSTSNQFIDQQNKVCVPITYFIKSYGDIDKVYETLKSIPYESSVIVADLTTNNMTELNNLDYDILVCHKIDEEMPDEIFFSEIARKSKKGMTCVVLAGYNVCDASELLNTEININMSKEILFTTDNWYATYSIIGDTLSWFEGGDLMKKIQNIKGKN